MTRVAIHVDITTEDINMGECGSKKYCALARASRRSLKRLGCFPVVSVDGFKLQVMSMNYGWLSAALPKHVRVWVRKFDDKENVDPISIDLVLTDE